MTIGILLTITTLQSVPAIAGGVAGRDSSNVREWTLQTCIEYAMENNISLKQTRNTYLSGIEETAEAKAAFFPSLYASTSHGFTNYPSSGASPNNSYTASYGLNASMSIFQGGRLKNTLKRSEIQNSMDKLSISETENDIRIAIIGAYMQCLYAAEAVSVNISTAEASKAQRDRAEQMWLAGSISKVDFAQLESQWKNNEYQVVSAQSTLDNYRLQLKQLLELDIMDEMLLDEPEITETMVLEALPSKESIYLTALAVMPEVKKGELAVSAAETEMLQAKAGYYPSLSLSAEIGTGFLSGNNGSGNQYWNNFNESIGLTLSIPIYSNRQNKTAVNKAKIAIDNSILDYKGIEKELLQEVESAYLDVVSSQSSYVAAVENEAYARQSYELTFEQFEVGIKNTVELITAQNDYAAARMEVLQAKYMTLMNKEILNVYQGMESNFD